MIGYIPPAFRRKIFEPLHAWKNGSPRLSYWKELERTQYLPEEELLEKQWRRLQAMLRFVYEENPFFARRFREAGVTPGDIRTPEDMALLPLLTKEEVRRCLPEIISQGFSREGLLEFRTGGSTGKALILYNSEECCELRNACARRHDRWAGWEPGETVGAVWGNPILPRGLKEYLKHALVYPTIYLDTMSVSADSVRSFAEKWQKTAPTLLFGHAHSIFLLAGYVRDLGISTIRPRGIIATSMMLIPHERKVIEEVFQVKVTDRYGCEEVGLIASECEKHEGLHLNIEHLFVEFLRDDGTRAAQGEAGTIVVTDLLNRAMPLVRYRLEDMGVPTERKCSCGRGLPLMESVTGRTADFLVRSDGTKIAGVSLIENTLTRIPGIDQMQIVQNSLETLDVNIVPGAHYPENGNEEIDTYFKGLLGEKTLVTIRHMDNIELEKAGKFRFCISKVV